MSWWSIWNEPNYGPDLAPQATDHDTIEVGAAAYRGLLNAAWNGSGRERSQTSTDTILIGETAPRGLNHPIGNFSGVKPLRFLRALYCVNSSNQELRGSRGGGARLPDDGSGLTWLPSRQPGAVRSQWLRRSPLRAGHAPERADLRMRPELLLEPDHACRAIPITPISPRFRGSSRRSIASNAVYGSHTRLPIWNTEYGWWTNPPDPSKGALPPSTAAYYMNWAEYLSYSQPRLRSYDQYLLVDPPSGDFASGLELASQRPLATFDAFEVPLYMPTTTAPHAASLVVWGPRAPRATPHRAAHTCSRGRASRRACRSSSSLGRAGTSRR